MGQKAYSVWVSLSMEEMANFPVVGAGRGLIHRPTQLSHFINEKIIEASRDHLIGPKPYNYHGYFRTEPILKSNVSTYLLSWLRWDAYTNNLQ